MQNEKNIPNFSKDQKITIKMENGTSEDAEIIFTFEINGDSYICYEHSERAHIKKIAENNDLISITEEEWPQVEKIYNDYINDQENLEKRK